MPANYKSAVHLFFLKDDHILLLRRRNTGYHDGDYSVVAGHLEPGEEVIRAAVREAQEEAGVAIRTEDVHMVGVMHRKDGDERIDFFAVAAAWEGDITNAEPHKSDQLAWFPLDALPENTIPYVRRAIHNYRQQRWFDTFGWES